jgi:glycosyltransferase involved in cell wall biosynthesis
MLVKQLSGLPFSFTAHGPEEFEKAQWLHLEAKLEMSEFAVCVSLFGRSQLMRWSRPDLWSKIKLVHCGLDDKFLAATPPPLPQEPRLTCVGRLSIEKAQLVLVGAVRRLRDEGLSVKVTLLGDGPMRRRIEEAIRAAKLEDAVTLLGWASGDRVKQEIANSRALVLPSFAENLPVVIMEAMALGRPVISTYVAGIPELVEPGKTGWLAPAGDETALALAIRAVVETPTAALAAMGAAGRESVLRRHDSLKEAAKLKALFEAAAEPAP